MKRLLGNIEAKTDIKGRVFLPATFRKVLQGEEGGALVLRKDVYQPCLNLYPEKAWNELMDSMRARINRWNPRHQQIYRQFLSDVEIAYPDASGRILIPRRLLEAAGITQGIRFIGTAIYTAMQGFLAAKCGAEYVAPYVNRIDNMGFDGVQVSKDIHDAITANGLDSGLLAASFKNSQQVLELTKYGVKAVTAAPDVIDGLVKNAAIDAAIDQFTMDFQGLVGEGKTMADC